MKQVKGKKLLSVCYKNQNEYQLPFYTAHECSVGHLLSPISAWSYSSPAQKKKNVEIN